MNRKIFLLVILGGVLLALGGYHLKGDPAKAYAYFYLGAGSWTAAILYPLVSRRPRLTLFLAGLLVLHTGIIILLLGGLKWPELTGTLLFILGILVIMNTPR